MNDSDMREIQEKLIDLLYDELDPVEREMVEQRLLESPELRDEYRKLKTARNALAMSRSAEPAQAPPLPAPRRLWFANLR